MTETRCRRCGVPREADVGLMAWDDGVCPVCLDKRGELAGRAVWRYLAEVLDPSDDYVSRTEPEQTTLPGVSTDA